MAVTWKRLAYLNEVADKTIAAWSKSIGSGGDYATWAAMIAAMPDMIAHAVTVTIKAGTTLTEECSIKNKHGLTTDAAITVQAEKYFPTSSIIPTADSATATTLRDAALATAALGDDYFNGCWVLVVDGAGTDNGFVAITDYVDATGDAVVASWPGTQPDNTSRYLIVGALVDGETVRKTVDFEFNSCKIEVYGIGFTNDSAHGTCQNSSYVHFFYCGFTKAAQNGIRFMGCIGGYIFYSGLVENGATGARYGFTNRGYIHMCALSDNTTYGILVEEGAYCYTNACTGDLNGTWGTYAKSSGQANCNGTECSGTSGNHSNAAGDGSLAY